MRLHHSGPIAFPGAFPPDSPHSMPQARSPTCFTDDGGASHRNTKGKHFLFFQAKGIDMTKGMRLASAWGIVHHHGGVMTSNRHNGSDNTVHVHLPADETDCSDPLMPCRGASEIPATILVVDDDEMALNVMSEMLRILGYRVITADRGRKAIDLYRREMPRIDLVLLDIMMPEMTGDIVFEKLKIIDPEVKVICASGYCAPETVEKMFSEGCRGFFPKPVNLTELSRHVRSVLLNQ
jgi:CheY-like chemotaxis protein